MNTGTLVAATTIGAVLFMASRLAEAAEVKVLSAVGMRQVMLDLGPKFERATGHTVAITFDSGSMIVKRIETGDTVDVVMIPRSGIEQSAKAGKVVAGSAADLASSSVGLAVRAGGPKPDISSPEAFKHTLLAASPLLVQTPHSVAQAESISGRYLNALVSPTR